MWQKIHPEIVDHLVNNVRPLRQKEECRQVFEKRIPLLQEAVKAFSRSFNGIFPLSGDFALLPEIKTLVDPSNDEDLTIESFESLKSELPNIVSRWKAKYDEDLDVFLKSRVEDIPMHVQAKDLALAHLFRCRECRGVFSTSNISAVLHNCYNGFYSSASWTFKREAGDDAYKQALSRFALDLASFSFFSVADLYVLPLLQACGKGRLTTVKDMDDLNPRLTCTVCWSEPGVRTIYTWRDAVSLHTSSSSLWPSILIVEPGRTCHTSS